MNTGTPPGGQLYLYMAYLGTRYRGRNSTSAVDIKESWASLCRALNNLPGFTHSLEGWKKIFSAWRNHIQTKKQRIDLANRHPECSSHQPRALSTLEIEALHYFKEVTVMGEKLKLRVTPKAAIPTGELAPNSESEKQNLSRNSLPQIISANITAPGSEIETQVLNINPNNAGPHIKIEPITTISKSNLEAPTTEILKNCVDYSDRYMRRRQEKINNYHARRYMKSLRYKYMKMNHKLAKEKLRFKIERFVFLHRPFEFNLEV